LLSNYDDVAANKIALKEVDKSDFKFDKSHFLVSARTGKAMSAEQLTIFANQYFSLAHILKAEIRQIDFILFKKHSIKILNVFKFSKFDKNNSD